MTEDSFGTDHSAKFRYKFYNSLAKDAQTKAEAAMRAMNEGAAALTEAVSSAVAGSDSRQSGYDRIDSADPPDGDAEEGAAASSSENTPLIGASGFLAPPAHIVPAEYYKIHFPLSSITPSSGSCSSLITV